MEKSILPADGQQFAIETIIGLLIADLDDASRRTMVAKLERVRRDVQAMDWSEESKQSFEAVVTRLHWYLEGNER